MQHTCTSSTVRTACKKMRWLIFFPRAFAGRWVPAGRSKEPNLTVSNLIPGQEYTFRVSSVNSEGQSEPLVADHSIVAKNPFGTILFAYSISTRKFCRLFLVRLQCYVNCFSSRRTERTVSAQDCRLGQRFCWSRMETASWRWRIANNGLRNRKTWKGYVQVDESWRSQGTRNQGQSWRSGRRRRVWIQNSRC